MERKKLTNRQIRRLAKKYIRGTASAEESALLHEWYNTVNPGTTEVILVDTPTLSREVREEIFAGLQKRIEQEKGRVLELPRRSVQWWHAAAVVLLLAGGIAFYRSLPVPVKKEGPSYTAQVAEEVSAPQTARAVITLAGGRRLYLDSIPEGTIAREGNTRVTKKADGVVYESPADAKEVGYNVLTVPRGSRVVNLTLSDGSRVWLNAESSMRYPVAFTGSSRNVEVTGEAYFEISKDPQRRFYISSRGLTTEVLGTHFNINTYADESAMKVTLLEGSVRVRDTRGGQVMLKPGQQAKVNGGDPDIQVEDKVDIEAVIAWKNDYFMMKGTDIGALARQMARWYDVQVVFEGEIPDRKFGGSISRNVNLSTMLEVLRESGINSRLEQKKVIIL